MRVNPLLWLHVQLAAGWRTNALIVLLYLAVFLLGSSIVHRLSGPGAAYGPIAAGALGFVTLSQCLFLLLLGPGAVHRSVQRDFQTGMIESHRLSPMSGARIALGYVAGGNFQAGLLYAASLLLGSFFAACSGLPYALGAWWGAQVAIVAAALMFSSLALMVALVSRGKVNVIGIAVGFCLLGGVAAIRYVPALGLLGGVMTGQTLWSALTGGTAPSFAADVAAVSVASQAALTVTFLVASFRKVRSPERPLFPLPLAFVKLGIVGAVLVAGIVLQDALPEWSTFDGGEELGTAQLVGSTIVFIAAAQFALIAAAVECFFVDRARAFGEAPQPTRRAALLAVPVLLGAATVLLMLMAEPFVGPVAGAAPGGPVATPVAAGGPPDDSVPADEQAVLAPDGSVAQPAPPGSVGRRISATRGALPILLALLLSFWTDFNWMYVLAAQGRGPLRAILYSALLLKALPFGVDGILIFASEMQDASMAWVEGYFSGTSPLGTVVLSVYPGWNPWPGLVAQLAVAGVATWMGLAARRRLGKRPSAGPVGTA